MVIYSEPSTSWLVGLKSAQAAISCQHTPQKERNSRAALASMVVVSGAAMRAQAAQREPPRHRLHAKDQQAPCA